MKRGFMALLGSVALVATVTAACSGGSTPTPAPTTTAAPTTPASGNTGGVVMPGDPSQAVQTFAVDLKESPYSFSPSSFNLQVGQTYHFRLVGGNEYHTFTVDDLGIDIEVDAGETVTFNYTPTGAGSFHLICIPHEQLGMTGEIKVS